MEMMLVRNASNVSGRASASTSTEEAIKACGGSGIASTTAKDTSASNAWGRAFASTTARDTTPSNAAGRASERTTAKEAVASNVRQGLVRVLTCTHVKIETLVTGPFEVKIKNSHV